MGVDTHVSNVMWQLFDIKCRYFIDSPFTFYITVDLNIFL